MIINITATPGKGKTYEATRKIVENLRKKEPIFSYTPKKLIAHQPPKNPIKNQE